MGYARSASIQRSSRFHAAKPSSERGSSRVNTRRARGWSIGTRQHPGGGRRRLRLPPAPDAALAVALEGALGDGGGIDPEHLHLRRHVSDGIHPHAVHPQPVRRCCPSPAAAGTSAGARSVSPASNDCHSGIRSSRTVSTRRSIMCPVRGLASSRTSPIRMVTGPSRRSRAFRASGRPRRSSRSAASVARADGARRACAPTPASGLRSRCVTRMRSSNVRYEYASLRMPKRLRRPA